VAAQSGRDDRDRSLGRREHSGNFQVEREVAPTALHHPEVVPDSEGEIGAVGRDEADRAEPSGEDPRQEEEGDAQKAEGVVVGVDV